MTIAEIEHLLERSSNGLLALWLLWTGKVHISTAKGAKQGRSSGDQEMVP
jgi:hypothetical protein